MSQHVAETVVSFRTISYNCVTHLKVHPKLKAEVNYFLQNIINPMSSLTARSFYHKHDRERRIMISFTRFSTIASMYS